jgi:hypothetical protein
VYALKFLSWAALSSFGAPAWFFRLSRTEDGVPLPPHPF